MRAAVGVRGYSLALVAMLLASALSASLGAVPSAPANLTARVVGNLVTLTWTPSAAAISYKLEAGSASGLSNVASIIVGSAPTLSSSVPNGTYFVRVRAIGADGESQPSNQVTVVVGPVAGCTAPPSAPSGLRSTVSGTSVTLTWLAGGGCSASNYAVRVGSSPGLSNLVIVNVGATMSLTASGAPGTYYVRVVAQNAFGLSVPSNEATVQIGGTGTPSAVCRALDVTLASSRSGDRDKAGVTLRFPSTTSGRALLNFTSYRRIGAAWVEYDWWREEVIFPPGHSGMFIDKSVRFAWRLEFRCDGQLLAEREGPGGS